MLNWRCVSIDLVYSSSSLNFKKRFIQLNSSITFQSHLFEQASQIHTRKTKKKTIFKTIPPRQSPPVYFFKRSEEFAYQSFVRGRQRCCCNLALFSAFYSSFFFDSPARLHRYFSRARQQLLLTTNFASRSSQFEVFTFWPISHSASHVSSRNRKLMTWAFFPAGLTHRLID